MVRRHRHTVPALIAAFLLGLVAIVPAAANSTAQTLPFTQDWTNTSLITVNDNWSGVPGVIGFPRSGHHDRGRYGPADAARRIRARERPRRDPEPDHRRHERRCRANSNSPTRWLPSRRSRTADAPYLLFHLDTTGASNVTVSYNLRDIDPTGDNAVQQVALQYRVGSTGNFTNVPAGYVADATTG